jgi:rhomboid protease GluP
LAEIDNLEGGARAGRPSVCRHCGALVGASETACSVCGTPVAAAEPQRTAPPQPDPATVRFIRAVVNRPATFTFAFILVNVFLYVLMSLEGGARGEVLVRYGAKLNFLISEGGQWWRFVTPIFLHVQMPGLGPLHLLTNMYGLFMLGPYVEKLYGSAKFVVIWVLTGVAGVVASYLAVQPELAVGSLGSFLFKTFDAPSAGASGALFGLIGVLFVFGIKFRHELPEGLKRAFGTGMLPIILINLFIGYVGSGFIDNAAHLGGLIAGMALALFVGYKRIGPRGPVAYAWHFLQVGCLGLVIVSFLMAFINYNRPLPAELAGAGAEQETVNPRALAALVEAVNAGNHAVEEFAKGRPEQLGPAIRQLEETPSVSPRADTLRDDLKTLLTRGRDLAAESNLPRAELERRRKSLFDDYGTWETRFSEWVATEGKAFGIVIRDAPPEGPPREP